MATESDDLDNKNNATISTKRKKSCGFQSMGLNYSTLKGILKKGYKVPTPIQRKTIPLIIEGKDVVAMARTGSGKTAAFLLPMFERLKAHSAKVGVRGLILSPTRELALQTFKFTKELGKFTDLKAAVVLGGDSMEDQFMNIHKNPDIIIATPGRLLHIVIEMDLKLSSVEYIVFDEADRLFEMGFLEQLQEILNRIPDHRQTLLFSATLPRMLVDFVKAGLNDPILIRLDTDSKLSEYLKTLYIFCRSDDKLAVVLHLLKFVIKPNDLTVIFVSTKHHVEYLKEILERASISCTCVYSSLDHTARKLNVEMFRTRKVNILIVTDIAARGIDIPHLDNVINCNFPAKPKLFVHRVGRVARAGRSGTAYSLIAPDEASYLLDLHLFLGQSLCLTEDKTSETNNMCGTVPQSIIDEESDLLLAWHESSVDLSNLKKVCENANKQYIKCRPSPSTESVRRMKEIQKISFRIHPIFVGKDTNFEADRMKLLESMKSYRPNTTIFELGATGKSQASDIMRLKRKFHSNIISKSRNQPLKTIDELQDKSKCELNVDENVIKEKFSTVFNDNKEIYEVTFSKSNKRKKKDENFYLSSRPKDHHSEKGLKVEKTFDCQVNDAVLDLTTDDTEKIKKQNNSVKWDRKKKKFMKDDLGDPKKKKIRTESGAWILASYKSDRYKQWKNKCKVEHSNDAENDNEEGEFGKERPGMKAMLKRRNKKQKHYRPELKTKEEILKIRRKKSKLAFHQKHQQEKKFKRKVQVKKRK